MGERRSQKHTRYCYLEGSAALHARTLRESRVQGEHLARKENLPQAAIAKKGGKVFQKASTLLFIADTAGGHR